MINEKELEKNAILEVLDTLEYIEPKLYCGYQCIEFDKEKCKKCKEKYIKNHTKWKNKKEYWENKLKNMIF